ncbi:hypothetical protein IJ674_04095 [bacterium]|nr:hypothetical protein [bacterium]
MKIYPAFRKSIYHLKQDIIHKINPEKCKFVLLEKTQKINIDQYKTFSDNTPQNADSFTIVTIGKREDKNYKKKITTFYSDGNVVERLFESTEGERIIREYEHRGHDVKDSNCRYRKIVQKKMVNGRPEFVTNLIEEMRTYISETKKNKKTGKNLLKLEIIKNIIDGNKISATITEYPFNGDRKVPKISNLRKIAGLEIELNESTPNITGTFETTNVKLPANDKYLPYRFILDTKTKIKELTKHFIKEKNLDKLNIKVRVKDTIGKNTAGYFDEERNEIAYAITTSDIAKTTAHEVEHAYQYCQIGRAGKGYSQYGRNSRKIYGPIDNLQESMEAHKYSIASINYPKLSDEEDLSKNMDYMNNYLEVKAREAGEKASKEYKDIGAEFNKQFFFGLQ